MEQINVNLIPGRALPVCHVSQYDVGRQIRCNLFEGDQVFALATGDTAELHVRKPDTTVVTASLTVVNAQTYLDITTTQQMDAVAGANLCEIQIVRSGNTLGTINFIMEVEADPLAEGINSESEIYDLAAQVSRDVTDSIGDLVTFRPYGIPPYMMSLFKPLTNIFSGFDNYISGAYYSASPAVVGKPLTTVTTPNWQGWLVRVKPNTTYTIGPHDFRILFYNNSLIVDKVINQADLSDSNPNTITSGSDSFWMAITQRITRDMSAWMMVEGSTYPATYFSGLPQWAQMPKLSDDQMTQTTIAYSYTPISIAYGEDNTTVTFSTGYIVTPKGTVATPVTTLTVNTSSWISFDVTANTWTLGQHINGHELYTIGWVNNNITKAMLLANYTETGLPDGKNFRDWGMVYCGGLKVPKIKYTSSGCTLTLPSCRIIYDGGTVVANAMTFDLTASNWLTYDLDAQEFHLGWQVTNHTLIVLGIISVSKYENSFIAGTQLAIEKTIAFFGDSICAGVGTSKVFHQYISERYGFRCLNYGYGGSGYVQNYESYGAGRLGTGNEGLGVPITEDNYFIPNNVLTRLAEPNPADLDGVVIFAGTNDWSHAGQITLQDFIDGIEAVFNYFQTNFAAVPLLVMTPIHRKNDTVPNAAGKTLQEYCDIIIDECRKFGVPYVDTMAFSGLHPDNAGNDATFYPRDDRNPPSSDGLHPNHIAHERIMRVVGETLNALVKYNDTAMR